MYVTLDVHNWLEKQYGRMDLTRIGNYVLTSSAD